MDLPREPFAIPQARKYNRTFDAPRNVTFGPEETVVINIPPIDRTYLTKNSKLHFDVTLRYTEATSETWSNIANDIASPPVVFANRAAMLPYVNGFFQRTTNGSANVTSNAINYYNKPMPFLDINGAYGFISGIKVYDYLGTTLLEDVQQHDVLTAMLADFNFKDENLRVFRPYTADNKNTASRIRKQPCSFFQSDESNAFSDPISLSSWTTTFDTVSTSTASIAAGVVTHALGTLSSGMAVTVVSNGGYASFTNGTTYYIAVTPAPTATTFSLSTTVGGTAISTAGTGTNAQLTILDATILGYTLVPESKTMTQHFSIDLYSFLGKLSDKFVPLHNGFRIEFTFNKSTVPISFSTAYGGLNVNYRTRGNSIYARTLDPSIDSLTFSKVYLKTDLLELPSEMDKEIDKVIHYQGFKYQQDFYPYSDFSITNVADNERPDFVKPIYQPLISLNKVMIGQRPVRPSGDITYQHLGFRIKNYVDTADLLFNKSVINTFTKGSEFLDAWVDAFGFNPDVGITLDDFITEEESFSGTNGFQFYVYGDSQRSDIADYLTFLAGNTSGDVIGAAWFPNFAGTTDIGSAVSNTWGMNTTDNQGRFLIVYDTRLPGTSTDTVAGINTSKNKLEYKLASKENVCWKVYIDVFCQHDALLKIDPGKTTTVSF